MDSQALNLRSKVSAKKSCSRLHEAFSLGQICVLYWAYRLRFKQSITADAPLQDQMPDLQDDFYATFYSFLPLRHGWYSSKFCSALSKWFQTTVCSLA